jgi:YVTN family beta-propeller protein
MLALVLLAGSLAMMAAGSAIAAPFAYVVGGAITNGTLEIAVIDANPNSSTFNQVISAIPNTSAATNLAITPDGSRGYVANDDGTVSVINTTSNTVVATITPSGSAPFFGLAAGIAITPDGSRAYSGARWDSSGNAFISVIDTVPTSSTYNQVLATIITGFHDTGQGIAVTPDGSRAYLTGHEIPVSCPAPGPPCTITTTTGQTFTCPGPGPCNVETIIEVVNTATNIIDLNPPTTGGCGTTAIAITPDGTRAYLEDFLTVLSNGQYICTPQLGVINLANNALMTTIPLPGSAIGGPFGLAITPDGNHAYVSASNQTDGLVLVVDTNPSSGTYNQVVTTIDLGLQSSADPAGIAVTPDGALVYLVAENFGGITSNGGGFVDVIATATNTIADQFNLAAGSRPTAVAITPAPAYSGGQLVFAPKGWDFGALKVGTSATKQFNIANGSQTQALQVNVMPATPNPPYSLLNGAGMATIGPGQSEKVMVQFKPTTVTATPIAGSVPITSSDPNDPSTSIPLSGRGK